MAADILLGMPEGLRVVTPENVAFEYELAGVPSRAIAWFLDVVLMACAAAVAGVALSLLGLVLGGLATAFYFVAVFVLQWGYGTLFEWRFHGQTIGKRLLGLRVLSGHGTAVNFTQALVRNLVRLVDIMPWLYLVGGLSALFDSQGRRLGDMAAATVVVRERHAPAPTAIAAPAERHNSFLQDPRIAMAAERITAPERHAMVGLSMRRDELPLEVRHRLFERVSVHLQGRLGIERPSFFSDERFVLNLTALALGLGGSPHPDGARPGSADQDRHP